MTDGCDSYFLTNGVLYGECNGHNGWQLWDRQIHQQSAKKRNTIFNSRITVWSSSLLGMSRKTFTNENNTATILKVLNWLRNAQGVGIEKTPLGLVGFCHDCLVIVSIF